MSAKPSPVSAPSPWYALLPLDNRYPALHALRVLAIFSVIQFHVTWIFALEEGIPLDLHFAIGSMTIFFGMDLFFLLSGFLIGSILLHSLKTSGNLDLRRFYLRRIFRTFPAYWVVLAYLVLVTGMTVTQRENLPYEILYATNFLPLDRGGVIMFWGWSLALEEQFYLTVPALFYLLQRMKSERLRFLLLGLLWLAPLVTRIWKYTHGRPWTDIGLYAALYFRTATRFDAIVAGIVLAFLEQRYGKQIGQWLQIPRHRTMLALPAAACLWILLQPDLFGAEYVQWVHVFAWGTLTSIMYVPALLLLLHPKTGEDPIQRFLGARGFHTIATLGYGIYLVHIPLLYRVCVPLVKALKARGYSMWVGWPLAFVVDVAGSLAIGYVLHILVEKPSLWLRQKVAG